MKKSISTSMMVITMLLSFIVGHSQIKNAKTASVKIYGNCGMCEKTIETAGNLKKVASVDWNQDTKMATLTYDSKKTNQDEILKRIALAGYDSDSFLAPDNVYNNLHGCCQYDREAKVAVKSEMIMDGTSTHKNHSDKAVTNQKSKGLTPVFDAYFEVKDALVKTDGATASVKAKSLLASINEVKMEALPMDVHNVWMKLLTDLKKDTESISTNKDANRQRTYLDRLSKNVYELIKVSKIDATVYYQFCPMANDGKGANWLSKDSAIKNPYYGSMMMSCGKTVETIK
ncbi:DUF3347 domain-containing protein [Flavobacterium ardleyense]|uniref:DUF3347 domain-containing protein n=1 Tax=Flavobacterium ardleyense TaxID=2038737 RepID=A0ABW5Z4I7_9FLAO